jgi:membrane-bound serine protease (ClpP class)
MRGYEVIVPEFFYDPNIAYIVLWAGLWIAVTSVHTPGTGIVEAVAFSVLIGTVIILLGMPTNWLSVAVMTAGIISFILIPFIKQQYTTLSLGGLVLQAVGGYFLFNGLDVSPVLIGVTVGLSLIYHYFVLLPALRQIRSYPVEERDSVLIGMEGRVASALNPIGTVQVNSELWSATSNKTLESGTRVRVLERNGLQLYVEETKDKRQPEPSEQVEFSSQEAVEL